MFEYVDLYMTNRPNGLKYVILNVYGGESLHHPDIVTILQAVQQCYEKYKANWHLTVTTTTNAIISSNKLAGILPLIDEFTVSYHVENSTKNKKLFRNNLLTIKAAGRRQKCVVLMHPEPDFFEDCKNMIEWLTQNQIKCLPRQLDHVPEQSWNYHKQQVVWFDKLYSSKGNHKSITTESEKTDLTSVGRACCGGRQLCVDQNYKQKTFFVDNNFVDWFCSVNHFFLYIKQVNGEVFTNKDCKMNFDGQVGSIGTLDHSKNLLDYTEQNLKNNTLPAIQCKKSSCLCGLCAPKSADLPTYNTIMKKYQLS